MWVSLAACCQPVGARCLVSSGWRCWGSVRSCRWLTSGLQCCLIHLSCLSVGIHKIAEHRIDLRCWPGFFPVSLFFSSTAVAGGNCGYGSCLALAVCILPPLQTAFKFLSFLGPCSGRYEAVIGAQQTVMITSKCCTSNHLAALGWMKKLICTGRLILCMF